MTSLSMSFRNSVDKAPAPSVQKVFEPPRFELPRFETIKFGRNSIKYMGPASHLLEATTPFANDRNSKFV